MLDDHGLGVAFLIVGGQVLLAQGRAAGEGTLVRAVQVTSPVPSQSGRSNGSTALTCGGTPL